MIIFQLTKEKFYHDNKLVNCANFLYFGAFMLQNVHVLFVKYMNNM